MSEMLDMQWMAMCFKFGPLLGLSAWAMALNLTFGVVNDLLKEWAEKAFPADSDRVLRIFNSRWYILIGFILNKLMRLKLPEVPKGKPTGNTQTFAKP